MKKNIKILYTQVKDNLALKISFLLILIITFIYVIHSIIETRNIRIVNFTNETFTVELFMEDEFLLSTQIKPFSELNFSKKLRTEGCYQVKVNAKDFYKEARGAYDSPYFGMFGDPLYVLITKDNELDLRIIRKDSFAHRLIR